MYKLHCLFLFSIVLFICSCSGKKDKIKEKPPVMVDIIIARKTYFPSVIEVNGSVLSEEFIDIYPEISGRIDFLNMPDGIEVKEGTVLARINDSELQAQLEQQKVHLDIAIKTEERLKKLLEINGVNQHDYDVALNEVNSINAQIKILQAQIEKTVIKAPFTGKLGLRMVSMGAYVSPQTKMGTLQQTEKIKIDFNVPEAFMPLIRKGEKIKIQANNSDELQTAVISAIEPQINTETRNIKVRAHLESGVLIPGTFVKVILEKEQHSIIVPTNAIIPDASSNQVVLIKNNKAVFVEVETGIRNAEMVAIKSGVNEGDSIIVSGILFVRPNTEVIVNKEIKEAKSDEQIN